MVTNGNTDKSSNTRNRKFPQKAEEKRKEKRKEITEQYRDESFEGDGNMDEKQTQLALKIVKLMRDLGFGCEDFVVSLSKGEYHKVKVVLYELGQRKLQDMGLDVWKLLNKISEIVKEHYTDKERKVVTISLADDEGIIIS